MMDKETNQARGFGFVAFYNNAAATLALRKLSRPEFRMRGNQVQVMWADPKRDEIGTEKVKSIYVGNLPEHYTEQDLRTIFTPYGAIERVTLLHTQEDPGKLRNYAFVNFADRASALKAVGESETKKHVMGEKELL
ncbi:putative RNA-binding protein 46, partial [Tetrabaena socialis]